MKKRTSKKGRKKANRFAGFKSGPRSGWVHEGRKGHKGSTDSKVSKAKHWKGPLGG